MTHIIPLSTPLRLLDQPRHQILVPKEPIIRPSPQRFLCHDLVRDPALLGALILPLQRIRQVPPVREPEPSVPEAVLDEGDEFLFDRVVEDGRGGGERGEREKSKVGCLVDGMGE